MGNGMRWLPTEAVSRGSDQTFAPQEALAQHEKLATLGALLAGVAHELNNPLSVVMLMVVTWIGFLIHVFSVGYMHEDDNFTRFFCFLSLFAAAMQPRPGEVPSRIQVNGFMYARPEVSGQNPFGAATPPQTVEELAAWREVWPPQIEDFAGSLERFDPASVPAGEWQNTLASQARELGRIFGPSRHSG